MADISKINVKITAMLRSKPESALTPVRPRFNFLMSVSLNICIAKLSCVSYHTVPGHFQVLALNVPLLWGKLVHLLSPGKNPKVSEILEHHCGYGLCCHTNASPCFDNYRRVMKEATQQREVREYTYTLWNTCKTEGINCACQLCYFI